MCQPCPLSQSGQTVLVKPWCSICFQLWVPESQANWFACRMDTPGVQELHSEMELRWDCDSLTCPSSCVVAEHVPSTMWCQYLHDGWSVQQALLSFRFKGRGHTLTPVHLQHTLPFPLLGTYASCCLLAFCSWRNWWPSGVDTESLLSEFCMSWFLPVGCEWGLICVYFPSFSSKISRE